MNRASATHSEQTSDRTLWTVLVCAAIALVAFFGWIVNGQSDFLSSESETAEVVLSQGTDAHSTTGSVSSGLNVDGGNDPADEPSAVSNIVSNTPTSADNIGWSDRADVPDSEPSRDSTPPLAQGIEQSEATLSPPGTQAVNGAAGQSLQSVVEKMAALDSHQQREAQHTASNLLTEPTPAVTEETVPPEELATVEAQASQEQTVASVNSPSSAADMGALRELLAEAAAITSEEDEQTRSERLRGEAIESLITLSSTIRFAPGSKNVSETMVPALDQIEDILAAYPDTMISVVVATHESGDDKQDFRLSQERGRALIARFVNEGLEFTRFSLKAESNEQLPANSHSVGILAQSES